jgi:hypothetical protein
MPLVLSNQKSYAVDSRNPPIAPKDEFFSSGKLRMVTHCELGKATIMEVENR